MTPAEHTAQRWLETRAPHETHQLGDVVVFEGVTMAVTTVIDGWAVSVGPEALAYDPALDPAINSQGRSAYAPQQHPVGDGARAAQTAWANGVQSGLAAASRKSVYCPVHDFECSRPTCAQRGCLVEARKMDGEEPLGWTAPHVNSIDPRSGLLVTHFSAALTPAQRYRLVEIAHETTDPAIRAAALGLLGGGG